MISGPMPSPWATVIGVLVGISGIIRILECSTTRNRTQWSFSTGPQGEVPHAGREFPSTTTGLAPLSAATVRYRSSRRRLKSPSSPHTRKTRSMFAASGCSALCPAARREKQVRRGRTASTRAWPSRPTARDRHPIADNRHGCGAWGAEPEAARGLCGKFLGFGEDAILIAMRTVPRGLVSGLARHGFERRRRHRRRRLETPIA